MSSADQMIAEGHNWIGVPYLEGGDSQAGIDCSHLVARMIRVIDAGYQYKTVDQIRSSPDFTEVLGPVDQPQRGDFISWTTPKHVAIIENPITGDFLGAQTSTGVASANFISNSYWANAGGRKVFRYRTHVR